MLASSRLELITPLAATLEGVVVSSETSHEGEYYLMKQLVIVKKLSCYLYLAYLLNSCAIWHTSW